MTAPCPGREDAGAAPPRPRVVDVVRAFLAPSLAQHALTQRQREVLGRITRCQTAAAGGHVMACARCGERVPMYNSCRDRHCPQCQWGAQLKWVEARRERILPVPYFHTVFTLPEPLRPLVEANPTALYGLLFDAVSGALQRCAKNPKWLGAMPGFTLVLHTWDRRLRYHPHLHGVITAGGLDPEGRWKSTGRPGRKSFLFPVRALAELFRGLFLHGLIARLVAGELVVPDALGHDVLDRVRAAARVKHWVVYAKRPFAGAEQVYRYLGSYTHRIGISNARLIAVEEGQVRFHTRDGKQERLSGVEFVSRLARHVLPRGFTRLRHYGLLAAAHVNTTWQRAHDLLVPTDHEPATVLAPEAEEGDVSEFERVTPWHPAVCPRCGAPTLAHVPQEAQRGDDTS